MRPWSRPVLVLGVALACQPSQADTSPFTTAPPTPGTTDASTGSSSTSGSSSSSSSTGGELSTGSGSAGASTGGTTLVLDVGTDQDVGPDKPAGCEGKIDFLFVISRAPGMGYFQAQLLDAFPKFIDTIEAKFADFDYHIMIVDGDDLWGLSTCDEQCPAQCVPDYPCSYTPTTCDLMIGAGTVFPAGGDAANKLCKIDGGRRYMTKGQTDLKSTFACAAQVGSSGRPWMGEALAAALQPGINGPGGCNDGFLRDDALLMVTQIANTFDYPEKPLGSKGTPEGWAAAVLKAKHDDPESIVMFSILDPGDPECHPDDRTCKMVKMFPFHLLADRNAPEYGPAFDLATSLVEEACADFVPPG
jgi:hypothetical protein